MAEKIPTPIALKAETERLLELSELAQTGRVFAEHIRNLQAELDKRQWRPIKDAPRDGTWVQLWSKFDEAPTTYQWAMCQRTGEKIGPWVSTSGDVWSDDGPHRPTHFAEILPEPPND